MPTTDLGEVIEFWEMKHRCREELIMLVKAQVAIHSCCFNKAAAVF